MGDHFEAQWALDLLEPDPDFQHSFGSKYFAEVFGIPVGFGYPCVRNFFMKRPMLAGFHLHIISMVVACVGGEIYLRALDKSYATRDAVLRDYIKLHPEDFPQPERKKLADVLDDWVPLR